MKTIIIMLFLYSAAATVPVIAAEDTGQATQQAADVKGAECPRMAAMLARAQDLQLTDDQIHQLKAIQASLVQSNSKTMAEIRNARMELGNMINCMDPDPDAIKSQMIKISDLELRTSAAKVDAYGKGFGLLNNDQKAKFIQLWPAIESSQAQQ